MNQLIVCNQSKRKGGMVLACRQEAAFLLYAHHEYVAIPLCLEHVIPTTRRYAARQPSRTFYLIPLVPELMVGFRHPQPPQTNRGVKPPRIGVRSG